MPIYDVTYKITHHRPFKATSEEEIRRIFTNNDIEIIEIVKIMEDSVMYDLDIHKGD